MKKLLMLATITSLFSLSALACSADGTEGFLPDNDLYIPANLESVNNANIDEETFNAVIDKVTAIYAPIVESKGATLKVIKRWDDGTVNAYAQQSGSTWKVSMFGGLARHEAVTPDGFALVVCHELGHHIGGAPKKGGRWASNEGQSDYFATLKCLRKVFKQEDTIKIMSKVLVPLKTKLECFRQFTSKEDRAVCERGSMAGMSTAKLFQALRKETTPPRFTTPSKKEVSTTSHSHPATQCRLDTYFNGALCNIDENTDVSREDEATGVCYRKAGDVKGVRPLCWFKPQDQ